MHLLSLSRLIVLCGSVVCLLFSSSAAWAQQIVSFRVGGQKVVGTLELPAEATSPPVVLMLHGFKGSRDEMTTPLVKEGVFAHAAKRLAAQGLASLRIDFRGGGDSEGSFEDTTISAQADDALAAIDYLRTVSAVDASRLAVLGWSQGGAVATLVAARSRHQPVAIVLWAPVSNPGVTLPTLLGADFAKRALASKGRAVTTQLPWGQDVTLKSGYFEDLHRLSPAAELARYPGPVFVAVGTKDPVVTPQPAMGQLLLNYHRGPHELWVRPMDHRFDVFNTDATLDELVDASAAFIFRHSR